MNQLEEYYSSYDEDGRLLTRHGRIEYVTTMKYIHECLDRLSADSGETSKTALRILEAGAGTGRYCAALAKEGYTLDALEYTEHNLEILRSKLTGQEALTAIQGNVLDMSCYADNTFDLTLILGPMYHLFTDADKIQALTEAVRVTKPGGYILAAYCMNEAVVIQEAFVKGQIKELLSMLTEDFHCISLPEELFSMVRIEEIHKFTETLPVRRLKTLTTDGAALYYRKMLAEMDEESYELWVKFHLSTCERPDLIGATNHSLDILQKLE